MVVVILDESGYKECISQTLCFTSPVHFPSLRHKLLVRGAFDDIIDDLFGYIGNVRGFSELIVKFDLINW